MTTSNQHRSTRRILIVDDIENNCLMIEDHLRPQLNFEFRLASSGNEDLKILENWGLDYIFCKYL